MSEPLERIEWFASSNPQWREMPNNDLHDDNLNKSWHMFELRACRVPRSLVFETQTCFSSTDFASVHSLVLNARALSAATGDMPDPVPDTGVHAFPDRVVWEWGVREDGDVLRIAIRTRSSGKRSRLGRGGRLRVVCRAEDDSIQSAASGVNDKGLVWETKPRVCNPELLRRIQADFATFCDNNVHRFLSGERVPADLHRRYERVSDMLDEGRMPDAHAAFAPLALPAPLVVTPLEPLEPLAAANEDQLPAAPAPLLGLAPFEDDLNGHALLPAGNADDNLDLAIFAAANEDQLPAAPAPLLGLAPFEDDLNGHALLPAGNADDNLDLALPAAPPLVVAPLAPLEPVAAANKEPLPAGQGNADDSLDPESLAILASFLDCDDSPPDAMDMAMLKSQLEVATAMKGPLPGEADGPLAATTAADPSSVGAFDGQMQFASTTDSPVGPRGTKRQAPPVLDLDPGAQRDHGQQRSRTVRGALSQVGGATSK